MNIINWTDTYMIIISRTLSHHHSCIRAVYACIEFFKDKIYEYKPTNSTCVILLFDMQLFVNVMQGFFY